MGLGYSDVRITFGGETLMMSWDGTEASAPIRLDGAPTQYQTADARHRVSEAVRLVCPLAWPEVRDWEEGSEAWDELEYETL